MTDKFIKLTNWLAKACGIFAAGCLFLSIVIITELVFERYLFKNAITWQTELVTMLLVASTFIGSAYVLSEKGHVNMEYLYTFLSEKNVTKLKIFTDSLCLIQSPILLQNQKTFLRINQQIKLIFLEKLKIKMMILYLM